ncbi:MAG: multi-sensor signal transduction histidine kinase [uncultured bacterium]|uniref:histidine kinase n=4 Tax=Candidatus Daviesiibacteriota TaxID=1752718 RepID=A0A0G0H8H3_9BACT|nr:MAG: multi-sensor signal transduction histidine kinase [uncultured bacterium]KKQ08389.1 MAG: Multi-sensor signal transduction histidine kinase [Candidatus Daviesbacteria bacterium GW2011_GWB1_36_5]KKQ15568.1 MAG: Multi-sensor signal transduction histidine kinase [Candidatus Daviesbacteria bacterium GW2011_GWA1_36_8]OGE17540.1 MAG: hypothetical protein A2858_01405 [Candidatus Daviesbacteria bacterium RIFCSPHIGHO2_01_FULL_36_37]OGE36634.1 MAG: hypothetical protein A3E66_03250 [Candidatus Davie
MFLQSALIKKIFIPFFAIIFLDLLIFFLTSSFIFSKTLLFIIYLILLFLSSVIFYILIKKYLSPIGQIKNASLELTKGNLANQIRLKTGDELEIIANALNAVALNIHGTTQKFTGDTHNLNLQNQKLQSILYGLAVAVIAVDKERNVVLVNKKAEQILNLEAKAIINKKIGDILKVYNNEGEISDLIYCPISSPETSSVMFSQERVKTLSQSKKESTVDFSSLPIETSSGVDLSCVITLRDITEAKNLDDMKMDFVSMAAHELRTPLTTLKGYISVFVPEVQNILNQDQKGLLTQIKNSSDQLIALVENLLSVSRIDRGAITLNMQKADWPQLISQTVSDLKSRALEKQIELTFTPPAQAIPQVSVDKTRITEVITNLITNAVKYTDPNGRVEISVETDQTQVTTHVKDNGHGIDKETLPYLFNKFFRVQKNKLEYQTRGTGLGLYITKSIVDLHHGKIWVESEVGKGSTFSFSLPL